MPAFACRSDGAPIQREQIACRRGEGFSARARDLRDPGVCRPDRSASQSTRSLVRAGASQSDRATRLQHRRYRRRDDPPRHRSPSPIQTGGRRMTLEATATSANYGTTASGSSFYAAMRILPRAQREAMFQIYSFCRQVDDIADSDGPRPERLAALQQWRDDIDALYQGHPPARLRDYAASVRTFGLKREDFLAIVDGMEMDVPQDIRAPDLATLDLYCDRVASAVGRLSVRV